MRRRLAAVLVADVVGYSRLVGIDEAGTLAAFKLLVKEHLRPVVRRHEGRVIKTTGDGVLVEFASAVDSVRCALDIQKGMPKRNRSLPPDRQLLLRIGINLGEIVIEKRDIFGDGVNVAVRVEALAEPGGICLSAPVLQQVRNKVRAEFQDLGPHRVKNIAEPVHVYRAWPGSAGSARPAADGQVGQALALAKPSVAVLPFVNMSGDADQAYFSDGITEDIITELSRFRTISVIARNSTFLYRNQPVDVRRIGRELGAQYVVEGSVRKLGQRVRITSQLISAETHFHVWADRYDVVLADIFAVQDDVTRRIVGALVPKIESERVERARRMPTGHARAYDLYLRGKSRFYAATTADEIAEAQRFLEQAIAVDPHFANPYCYLAMIFNNLTMYKSAGTPLDALRKQAWRYAQKAAALDDSDPRTHTSLAWCHLWRGEFERARKHFETAERLNPNDADCAVDRGTGLMYLGEPEAAIESMMVGVRLDPRHSDSYLADLAEAYFVARRYDEMIAIAERIRDSSPRFPAWKAAAYAFAGRMKEARREARKFVEGVHAIWAGNAKAGPADYVAWLFDFSPFRRKEDVDHFVRGLRAAGLPEPGRQRAKAGSARHDKPGSSRYKGKDD